MKAPGNELHHSPPSTRSSAELFLPGSLSAAPDHHAEDERRNGRDSRNSQGMLVCVVVGHPRGSPGFLPQHRLRLGEPWHQHLQRLLRACSGGRDLLPGLIGGHPVQFLDVVRKALGAAGFAWVAAGGLFYTIGIVSYTLDARFPRAHAVWQLFVLAGSATHYFAILYYVL